MWKFAQVFRMALPLLLYPRHISAAQRGLHVISAHIGDLRYWIVLPRRLVLHVGLT